MNIIIENKIKEIFQSTNITGCCIKLHSLKYQDCLDYLRQKYPQVNPIKISELLYWFVNDIKDYPKCLCGKDLKFENFNIGYKKYCSHKCSANSKEVRDKYRKTCLEKYGVSNVFSNSNIKEKIKNTCLLKYGDTTPARNKKVREKYKKTCNEKYGVDNASKVSEVKNKKIETNLKNNGTNYPLQNKDILLKAHNTCIDRYGVDNPMRCEEIKKHFTNNFFQKYGSFYPGQLNEVKEKIKKTNFIRYGVDCITKSEEMKKKSKQTCLERYGVEHYTQSQQWKNRLPILSRKMSKRYIYNNMLFDSSPELAIFIYLSDLKISFEYHPDIVFYYFFNDKKYSYYPDFKVNNELWEIKGDHFFNKTGELIDPYDSKNNEKCRCKYECMMKNHIKILKYSEYSFYLKYVSNKYGKKYLYQFKQY